jgi:hypothetical protein
MIIAERMLTLRDDNRDVKIPISIFAPVCNKPGAWFCRYDVGWPEGLRSFEGWGVDGIQALVATFAMIGAEIYSSSYHQTGRLFWDKPGNGYGFPVVPTLRGLLVGDDAKYL